MCAPQACRDGEHKAGISCFVLTIATGLWSIWLWLGKHGTHGNRYDASLILIMQQEADFLPLSATLFSWLDPFHYDVWGVIVLMFALRFGFRNSQRYQT